MFSAFVTPLALSSRSDLHTPDGVCKPRIRQRTAVVRTARMHGGGPQTATSTKKRPGEQKGFVEEMRMVAMRLHTKDQAREGEQETSALPIDQWFPSKDDFMQFLVDSRCVYSYFETELAYPGTSDPVYSRLANSGLERLPALDKDIEYLNSIGVETPPASPAATRYIEYLRKLIHEKPESVLCHWYNYYFAHSAGGRMIGRLMQDRLFDGRTFSFYEWETDVKQILNKVRAVIDEVAKSWSRDLKDDCLKETGLAFGYSGTVLENLAKAAS